MAAVNEWVVREYFESLGFLVTQPQKHKLVAHTKEGDEDIDLLVVNPRVKEERWPTGMVWTDKDLKHIPRAVVGVRGWHTERFTPAVLKTSPEIYQFASDDVIQRITPRLGGGRVARILCLSGLPATGSLRKTTLDILGEKGIDGVILFRSILLELIRRVDINRNYEKSDLLQILRLLKNYDLVQKEQMELFGRKRRKKANG